MTNETPRATMWKVIFLLLAAATCTVSASDGRRPVYVFGHMANSIEEFDQFMAEGVNAIEADVTFSSNGTALKFFHGAGCDDKSRICVRQTKIGSYLTHVRDTVSAEKGKYKDKMLLLYADLKTGNLGGRKSKYNAGATFAENLVRYLWKDVPDDRMVNVLLSVYYTKDGELFRGAVDALSSYQNSTSYLDHVGFDVSLPRDLPAISRMYDTLGVTRNLWQGVGAPNPSIDKHSTKVLTLVTKRRTQSRSAENYVDKAYVWTVDKPETIRRFLSEDIDGIVTNKPSDVLRVLEDFSSTLRLATSSDNPWERFVRGNAVNV